MGREFMPELEEGSLWIRGIFPVNCSLDDGQEVGQDSPRDHDFRSAIPKWRPSWPRKAGRTTAPIPACSTMSSSSCPCAREEDWPVVERPNGHRQVRTRREIVADMNAELNRKLPGIEWQFSQYIRDNVMEAISGVKGDNCVKIYGPDLDELEELAEQDQDRDCRKIQGLHDLGIYRIMGQSNLEFAVDKEKCKRWGVQVADVNNVINTAVHGNAMTQMVEGEKLFDITLRWPLARRPTRAPSWKFPWTSSTTS